MYNIVLERTCTQRGESVISLAGPRSERRFPGGGRRLLGVPFAEAVTLAITIAAAVALTALPAEAANLGPHDVVAGVNPCRECHNTASGIAAARGWAGTIPAGASTWAKSVSVLCYYCHLAGSATGATNQAGNAYDDSSHSYLISDSPRTPDGVFDVVPLRGSGLPYAGAGSLELECTSCHNVHSIANRPFSHRATYQALCDECHPGRVNNDSATSYPGSGFHAYETHPTQQSLDDTAAANIKVVLDIDANLKVAIAALPGAYALGGHLNDATGDSGVFDCQTCHAVHGPTQGTAGIIDTGLLAVDNTTVNPGGSPLCEGCHYGGDAGEQVGAMVEQSTLPAGEWSDHPIDANNNTAFYPTGAAVPDGLRVAADWGGGNPNGDIGAQPFYPAAGGDTPVCSTCHDVHGSLPATQLLRGPSLTVGGAATWAFSYDGWCFVCHLSAEIIPNAHHSVINNLAVALGDSIDSQLSCGDCHGGDGVMDWKAHNGFWAWDAAPNFGAEDHTGGALGSTTPATNNSNFCLACHMPYDPLAYNVGLKTGRVLTSPFPTAAGHGTSRGSASHYLDVDSDEFSAADPDAVAPNLDPWPSSGSYSEYGPPNAGSLACGPAASAPSAGAIICESCHHILCNDGAINSGNYSSALKAGWESNLLLEPYQDDPSGAGGGAGANGIGSALCTGCHDVNIGIHHPLTGDIVSLSGLALRTGVGSFADQTAGPTTGGAAPGTLSYPNADALDCDSCHRPHGADDDSVVPGALHGAGTSNDGLPTYHILEVDGPAHGYTPDLCRECHAK